MKETELSGGVGTLSETGWDFYFLRRKVVGGRELEGGAAIPRLMINNVLSRFLES